MSTTLFWHRRDLRIHDNAGLYKALKNGCAVRPVFVFDRTILDGLPKNDQRMLFIYREIERLKNEYARLGTDLLAVYGDPLEHIPALAERLQATHVFANRDYEPAAIERDNRIHSLLQQRGIGFTGAKDHVIFEKSEVVKPDGKPYTVFTPYKKRWKETLNDFYLSPWPSERYCAYLQQTEQRTGLPSLQVMGFSAEQLVEFPERTLTPGLLETYHETRDIPGISGTSRMSVHLRFGTVSIRGLVRTALAANEKYLDELIWREFYQAILYHFPQTATQSFKPEYDRIRWEHNAEHFERWRSGTTGYPLVDAGMRELRATGYMHNRVRMVAASFLTKHLLTDWRLGERYFAEQLLDFELASNVGGWQWAAGCGCDAAPYFRIFNPVSQQQRFDPDWSYVRKWVPEFGTPAYPEPVVDHVFARQRVLERFKEALEDV